MRLLKHEVFRITHDILLWASTLMILLAGTIIAVLSRQRMMRVTDAFLFESLLRNPMVPIWAAVLLVPVVYSVSMKDRTLYAGISRGYGHAQIIIVKLISVDLLGIFAVLITLAISLSIVRPSAISATWSNINLFSIVPYIVFCSCIFTVSSIIALICRDLFVCVAANVVFAFLLMKICEEFDILKLISGGFLPPAFIGGIAHYIPSFFPLIVFVIVFAIGLVVGALVLYWNELK